MKNITILILLFIAFFDYPISTDAKSFLALTQDDSVNYIKITKNFLLWYKDNHAKIENKSFVFLNGTDTSSYYRIDFIAVDEFLKYLKSSGLFSDSFLLDKGEFFKMLDINLNYNKIKEGNEILELSGDLLLYSMDSDELLNNNKNVEITNYKITNYSKIVELRYSYIDLLIEFNRNNKINKIYYKPR